MPSSASPETIDGGSPTVELPAQPTHPRTFRLLQVLRAVAALMVVAHHTTIMLAQRFREPGLFWLGGAAGVDLFFVLSGLVMTLSAARIPRSPAGAWTFLRRRLERIVPLYWIATTAKLLLAVLFPALAINAIGGAWHVISSFLFIPSLGPSHTMEPVLVVGWTLELEMLFYLLYSLSLLLGRSPWLIVAPALVLLACTRFTGLGRAGELLVWSDPITFEFLFGMALGAWALRGRYLPLPVGILVGVLASVLLLWPWAVPVDWREVAWGLPATAILASTLSLEQRFGNRAPALALHLGDASYSIYLTHGFVLPFLAVCAAAVPALAQRSVAITLAVLFSAALGLACYSLLELPMLRFFHLRRTAPAQ